MASNCSVAGLCQVAATTNATMMANASWPLSSVLLGTTIFPATTLGNSSTTLNGTKLPSFFHNFAEVDPEFANILSHANIATRWLSLVSIILSLVGNLAVIAVIVKGGKLPVYKQLILHLAVTDIVYSFFQIFWLHRRFNEHRWVFGEPLCRMTIMWSSAITCSIFVITFIAVERYRSIIMPLLPKLSGLCVWVVMGLLWCVAIAIHVPFAVKRKVVTAYGNTDCEETWREDEIRDRGYYSLVVFIATYPVPILILAFCYTRIASRVLGRFPIGKRCESMRISTGGRSTSTTTSRFSGSNNNNVPSSKGCSQQKKLRHNKLIVMLSFILAAFIITTTPNQVLIMWLNFAPKTGVPMRTKQRTYLILHVLSSLVHLHSCINPVIYCLSDSRHRRDLYNLVRSCCTTGSRTPPMAHSVDSTGAKSRLRLSPNRSGCSTSSPLLPVADKTSYQLALSDTDEGDTRITNAHTQPLNPATPEPETSM